MILWGGGPDFNGTLVVISMRHYTGSDGTLPPLVISGKALTGEAPGSPHWAVVGTAGVPLRSCVWVILLVSAFFAHLPLFTAIVDLQPAASESYLFQELAVGRVLGTFGQILASRLWRGRLSEDKCMLLSGLWC